MHGWPSEVGIRSADRLARALGGPKSIAQRTLSILLAVVLVLAGIATSPTAAFAKYSNPSVSVVAQARTDGALHVVEQRAFSFDDRYSMIAWPVSDSSRNQEVDVQSIHLIQTDESGNAMRAESGFDEVPFQTSWRSLYEKTDGSSADIDALMEEASSSQDSSSTYIAPFRPYTYALDARANMIYLFVEPIADDVTIECDYEIANAVTIYDDISELYWEYACEWPDSETSDLSAEIQLPVPDGDVVEPGENVLAWGHGPEGSVAIGIDGTINFEVPSVRSGASAYAHVLFPKSWVSNITSIKKVRVSGTRFDSALAEERSWIDSSAGWWLNRYSIEILLLGLALAGLLLSLVLYSIFGRQRKDFEEAECNVVTKLNEAVVARLLRWNHWSIKDFPTSVKDVAESGAIAIYEDDDNADMTRFVLKPKARSIDLDEVRRATMSVLFDDFGLGYESVTLAELEKRCESSPDEVRGWISDWQKTLSTQVDEAGLFDRRSFLASRWTWAIGALVAIVALIELFGIGSFWPGILMLSVALAICAIAHCMPRLTCRGEVAFVESLQRPGQEASSWEERMKEALSGALLPKGVERP